MPGKDLPALTSNTVFERALWESEQRFRAVADYTYDWESWHNVAGQLIWVNPAVERLTGYSVDACLAMEDYPLQIVDERDRQRMRQWLESARQGSSGPDVEFRIQTTAGKRRWIAIAWQPIFDGKGNPAGFRSSGRDITDRKRMEQQIRRYAEKLEQLVAQRTQRISELEKRRVQVEKLAALGQLAAGVAHEINNPLAGMRNAFELIKQGLPTDNPYYHYLELIDSEIDRIGSIVHQMYQLYRPRPGHAERINLATTIEQVTCLIEVASRKRAIQIQQRLSGDLSSVQLPDAELKQILYNLLLNAIQASPAGGEVWIEAALYEGELRLSVRDAGTGIAADVLPRIFDPFFTTRSTSGHGGMGLGLSVSRSLAESLGGWIEVETALGQGSCFTAVIPQTNLGMDDEHDAKQ